MWTAGNSGAHTRDVPARLVHSGLSRHRRDSRTVTYSSLSLLLQFAAGHEPTYHRVRLLCEHLYDLVLLDGPCRDSSM